jgi:hypothetical protein
MAAVINLADIRKAREPQCYATAKLSDLPFVALRPGKGHCFWSVRPTGSHETDLNIGRHFALLYLEYCARRPLPLIDIIAEMPREITAIEMGFLDIVGDAASVGWPVMSGQAGLDDPPCA